MEECWIVGFAACPAIAGLGMATRFYEGCVRESDPTGYGQVWFCRRACLVDM